MANLSYAVLLFVIAFMYPKLTSCNITPSLSYAASNQLKYWSQNVQNNMPAALLSKLCPLNKDDSDFFTSLVSKQSFRSNPRFCSLANLACYSELNTIVPLGKSYGYISNNPCLLLKKTDPFSFFRMSILKRGNRVHLPNLEEQFPQRAFLPSQIASKISLVESQIAKIFPQSFVNPYTRANIETSIHYCSATALKEEIKSCPKSLEDMIDFSKATVGSSRLVALTSASTKGSNEELIIGNVKKLNANKIVSCHQLFLPFSTYFCHMPSSTQIHVVDVIEPQTKAPVNTVLAVCHMDTSTWPSDHAAFKILNLSPGKGEACHWLAQDDLAFIGAGKN